MALNRDKVLREAEKLVQRGKVEQAIREYEKVLKSNPNDANTINRVGDLYGRVGQVEKAIELYERIADYFTQDGFTTKAIAMLKKINRLAPQRLDIFDRLAELYIQQGLKVEAKNQYGMLAEWYARNGDHSNAIRIHRKLADLEPGDHMVHLRLADALMQGGEPDEALAVYDRLGRMLLDHDRLDEAERLYRHVLEQQPQRGDFLVPFCQSLLKAARTGLAHEFVEAAVRLSPENREVQALKAQLQLATGDASTALENAKKVYLAEPESATKRLLYGRALLAAGQPDKARGLLLGVVDEGVDQGNRERAQEAVRLLVEAYPRDVEVLERAVQAFAGVTGGDLVTMQRALAEAYDDQGRSEKALVVYEELAAVVPGDAAVESRIEELRAKAGTVASPREPERKAPAPAPAPTPAPQPIESHPSVTRGPSSPSAPTEARHFQPQERLAEANVFAKYGLVDKALGHLRAIIEQAPEQWEARERLVALLVEQDRRDEAAAVAEALAEHYREAGDVEQLAKLNEAVGLAPTAAAGVAAGSVSVDEAEEVVIDIDADLLAEVGIDDGRGSATLEVEIPAEGGAQLAEAGSGAGAGSPSGELEGMAEFRFDEPAEEWSVQDDSGPETELTFELEAPRAPWEIADVSSREAVPAPPQVDADAPRAELEEGSAADGLWSPAPLEASLGEQGGESAGVEFEMPPPTEDEDLVEITSSLSGVPPSELEQIDFFIAQELYEDAVRMLSRLEADYPDASEIADRRLVLKSKGVVLEDLAAPAVGEQSEDLFAEEEEYIDLAKELEAELAEEEAMVDEATGRGKDEALLEEVFREFQKGVSEQLSEEDSDTHFNLGIAYKEMGLLPEAIGEFQIASRDPAYFLEACSMIGVCYLEQGLAEQGAQWYRKALEAPNLSGDGRVALQYDLAVALEFAGDNEQAVALYEEIVTATPGYRDVDSRLVELQRQRHVN